MIFQRVAILYAHDVLIEDMTALHRRLRRDQVAAQLSRGKCRIVVGGISLARRGPAVQIFQLHAQHRGLQLVDPEVAANHRVKIFRLPSVHAQDAHAFGQFGIVGSTESRVAEGTEILAGKE